MREYGKSIDRNHWMAKIQKFSFNVNAEEFYQGYCPFFWATWVALLVSPFAALVRGFAWGAVKVFGPIAGACDAGIEKISRVEKPSMDCFYTNYQFFLDCHDELEEEALSDEQIEEFCKKHLFAGKAQRAWFNENTGWLPEMREAHAEYIRQIDLGKEKKRLRQKKIDAIASLLVKGLKGFVVFAAVLIGFAIFKGIEFMFVEGKWWDFLVGLAFFTGITCSGVVLFLGLHFVAHKGLLDWIPDKVINPVGKGVCWIGRGFAFIRETIQMLYTKKCPLITWGDETSKITKNK
jgi:hypothetical protein